MKRFLCMALICALALNFVACGQDSENSQTSKNSTESSEIRLESDDSMTSSESETSEQLESSDESSEQSEDSGLESDESSVSENTSSEESDKHEESNQPEGSVDNGGSSNNGGHKCKFTLYGKVPPSCDTEGYLLFSCNCGETKSELSGESALGHKFGEWKITREATCDQVGSKTRRCKACYDDEVQDIAKLAHSWDERKTTTLSRSGCGALVKVYTCKICGQSEQKDSGGKHTYGEAYYQDWEQLHNNGMAEYLTSYRGEFQKCKDCGYVKTLIKGHECDWGMSNIFDNRVLFDPGNCVRREIYRFTCPTCAYHWDIEYDYGPHDWVSTELLLTEHTDYTNERYIEKLTCKQCDFLEYGSPYSKTESPYEEVVFGEYKYDFWVCTHKYWGINNAHSGSVDDINRYIAEHPEVQDVYRNPVYDENGELVEFTYRFAMEDGSRYEYVLSIADILQVIEDFDGFHRFEGDVLPEDLDKTKLHYIIGISGGKPTVSEYSWTS